MRRSVPGHFPIHRVDLPCLLKLHPSAVSSGNSASSGQRRKNVFQTKGDFLREIALKLRLLPRPLTPPCVCAFVAFLKNRDKKSDTQNSAHRNAKVPPRAYGRKTPDAGADFPHGSSPFFISAVIIPQIFHLSMTKGVKTEKKQKKSRKSTANLAGTPYMEPRRFSHDTNGRNANVPPGLGVLDWSAWFYLGFSCW